MFDAETVAFLESGCALIVAAVAPDGSPRATRGWGLAVTSAKAGELRLILQAADGATPEYLLATRRIAVTACSVRTLHSLQCKGDVTGIEPVTERDHERVAAYCDEFFADVEETDGVPRELLDRMVPPTFIVCTVHVRECFNQSPGPGAGAPLATL